MHGIFLLASVTCLNLLLISSSNVIDPCERQPFQATCGSNAGRTIGRSQFVLRFYRRGDECVSYPYALCKGSSGQPELFKRKQDCEQACIAGGGGGGPSPDSGRTERPKKLTSANVFQQMTTSPRVEVHPSVDSSEQNVKPSVRPLTKCQQQRQLAQKENQANADRVNIQTGVIYSCTADGAFEEIQCHEHSQVCWCVDKDGVEIAGTRKQADEGRPDCRQKPIELQQNKPSAPICGPGISPLLEQSGQIYNCFGRACPKGYKCMMGPTMAACCPASSADDNQSASNLVQSTAKSCTLPKDRGTCNKFELRFYYSTEFKECKYFFYGGCGGNDNNFKDLAECEKACGKSSASSENFQPTTTASHQSTLPDINRCLHPKDSGPCNGRFIRWYWNEERKLCEVFHYGGCKGSGNNFGSREECLKECSPNNQKKTKVTVAQPATVEPIPFSVRPQLASHATPRVETVAVHPQQVSSPAKSPDVNTQKMEDVEVQCKTKSCAPECLAITNGRGCVECMCPDLTALQVTKPRTPHTTTPTSYPTSALKVHEKIDEIPLQPVSSSAKPVAKQPVKNETVDKCLLPLDKGPCTGPVQSRWGFSAETGRCEKFDYTGCGGNMNHFYSLKECNIHCKAFLATHPVDLHKSDDVNKKPHPTAEIEKVTTSQASIPALTTAKPVVTVEQTKIAEDVDPVCSLPRDSGPCMDFMMKWFYNAVTGKCEQFQYGSCGGNSNNFDTEDMCKLRCVSGAHALGVQIPAACSEEKDPGPCFGYIVRFYYNPRNMRCELFVYGGCGGNSNNFETKEACDQICPVYEKVWRNTASEQAQFAEPSLPISTKIPPDAADSESSILTTTHETTNDVETKLSEMPTLFTDPGNALSPSKMMIHREPSVYQTPGAVMMPSGVVEDNYQKTVLNMIGAPTVPNYVPEPYEASATVDGYGNVPPMPDYSVGSAQAETPTCPNGLPVRLGADGQPVLCLPGKTQCPPSSGCYFNGIDFFCCPEEEPQSFNFYLTAPPPQTSQPNSVDDTADGYPLRRVTRGVEVTNSAVKRSAHDDMHPEEVGMNMLPNLPLVSPLKAPSLGMPYDQQQAVPIPSGNEAYAQSQARPKELVNGIFGPNSDYHPVVPQPPTLSAGVFSSAGKRSPYCDEPKNPGPCKGSHLRFYYDKAVDDCRLFYYGGCQGNRNNFGTIDLCRQECVLRAKYTACPGGLLPLGGKTSPVTCGPSAGGIECPEDYVCHKGFFHICCPKYVENRDLPAGAPGHLPDPPKMAPMPEELEQSKLIPAEANRRGFAVQKSDQQLHLVANSTTVQQQVQQQSQQLQDRGGPPMFAMIQPQAASIDPVANGQILKSPIIQHQMLVNASSMANQQVPMMQRPPVMSRAMPQSNFAGHQQQMMIQQNNLGQNAAVLNNPSVEKSMFSDTAAHVESSLTASPQGLPTTPVQMSPAAYQFQGKSNTAVQFQSGVHSSNLPMTPVSGNVPTIQPSLPNHQSETQPALMSFPQAPVNVADSPTLFHSSQQQVQGMPPAAFGSEINVPLMNMELAMSGVSQTPRPQLQTDTCHLPPDQGRLCSSSEQSPKSTVFYYFDSSKNDCITLQYAGCGGNANRFSSRNDCFRVCHQGLLPLQP